LISLPKQKQQSDRFVKKYDLNSIANVGPHKSQPKCLVVDRKGTLPSLPVGRKNNPTAWKQGKLKSFKPLIWEFGSTEERNAWVSISFNSLDGLLTCFLADSRNFVSTFISLAVFDVKLVFELSIIQSRC